MTSGESDIPKCDSEEALPTNNPEAEAFRSLATNKCDIAFISNSTLFENTGSIYLLFLISNNFLVRREKSIFLDKLFKIIGFPVSL